MSQGLSTEKKKVTIADHIEVVEALNELREQLSKREGREVGLAEVYKIASLDLANKTLRKQGKKKLNVDWRNTNGGGRYAAGGEPVATKRPAKLQSPAASRKAA